MDLQIVTQTLEHVGVEIFGLYITGSKSLFFFYLFIKTEVIYLIKMN